MVGLDQGPVSFVRKGPDNKSFWLCGPWGSLLQLLRSEAAINDLGTNEHPCSSKISCPEQAAGGRWGRSGGGRGNGDADAPDSKLHAANVYCYQLDVMRMSSQFKRFACPPKKKLNLHTHTKSSLQDTGVGWSLGTPGLISI